MLVGGGLLGADAGGGQFPGLTVGAASSLQYPDLDPFRPRIVTGPIADTSLSLTVEWRESGTLRATRTIYSPDGVYQDEQLDLTSAEIASIVNPNNLEIWITANGVSGTGYRSYISQLQVRVPESSANQIDIAGAVSGAGTASATLVAKFDVRGTSAGVGTPTGRLDALFDVRAVSAGVATVAGRLDAKFDVRGGVSGGGSLSAVLVLLQPLSGAVPGPIRTWVNDTFTDADGTAITAHTGETGATWTDHPATSGYGQITGNRLHPIGAPTAAIKAIYASGVPGSVSYVVRGSFYPRGTSNDMTAIAGRLDTTNLTGYLFGYSKVLAAWGLWKVVAGTLTLLDSFDAAVTNSVSTYNLELWITDGMKWGTVDGVVVCASTDNTITAAGRVGVYYDDAGSPSGSTNGLHWDSVSAADEIIIGAPSILSRVGVLQGTSAGVGTPVGALNALSDVRGSSAGVGTPAGRLDALFDIRGAASGLATLSTILTKVQPLAGNVSGVGTPAGALVAVLPLSGSVSGLATLSTVLQKLMPLSGSASGLATLSTVLQKVMPLSGSVSGLATLSTVLQRVLPLTGSVSGAGSAAGTLVLLTPISGSVNGLATLSDVLVKVIPLIGSVSGLATVFGDIALIGGVIQINMSGTSAGVGTLDARLDSIIAMAGAVSGSGLTAAQLYKLMQLAGDTAGAGSASAVLNQVLGLQGDAFGSALAQAQLNQFLSLIGQSSGVGSAFGNLQDIVAIVVIIPTCPTGVLLLPSETGVVVGYPTDVRLGPSETDVLVNLSTGAIILVSETGCAVLPSETDVLIPC